MVYEKWGDNFMEIGEPEPAKICQGEPHRQKARKKGLFENSLA